ncbi:MAG: hypothetical protein R3C60_14405 [Parvularculaceae bacterium]
MTERLKEIWSSFEKSTTRRLTGRGVENIDVPHRTEMPTIAPEMPENITEPAIIAFEALKHRLSEGERRSMNSAQRKKDVAPWERGGERNAPPAPLSSYSEQESAPQSARDLIRGLRSTEMRVSRRDADYGAWLSSAPKGAIKLKTRRKFFGLF